MIIASFPCIGHTNTTLNQTRTRRYRSHSTFTAIVIATIRFFTYHRRNDIAPNSPSQQCLKTCFGGSGNCICQGRRHFDLHKHGNVDQESSDTRQSIHCDKIIFRQEWHLQSTIQFTRLPHHRQQQNQGKRRIIVQQTPTPMIINCLILS